MKKQGLLRIGLFLFVSLSLLIYRHYGKLAVTMMKNATIIIIDVGHGGSDPGKVSTDGIEEKNVNLQIALFLKDYLIAQDYTVHLTRESDIGLYDEHVANKKTSDLNNRVQFFKEKNADYVVSIHQNSFPDASQHGAQTFYYAGSREGEAFAASIQKCLLAMDSTNKRAEKSSDSYYLLKHSESPAVIVECGFLSNPEEAARLTDPNYQKQVARAICQGIQAYTTSPSQAMQHDQKDLQTAPCAYP